MFEYIKVYIKDNLKSIIVLFLCLLMGLVIGLIIYQFVDDSAKVELVNTLKTTLESSKQENFVNINVIKNGMISNIILIAIIYFCSITFIAPQLVCIINSFKGLAIGMYIPTIFQIFGIGRGILVLFLLVILPNIVYIPAYIYISLSSLKFHYSIVQKDGKILGIMLKEIYKVILGFSIISLSVILEQLLSLGVINIYLKL